MAQTRYNGSTRGYALRRVRCQESRYAIFPEKQFNFLTGVLQQRLQESILPSFYEGEQRKMAGYAENGTVHRTTSGHFLEKRKWDDEQLEETQIMRDFR